MICLDLSDKKIYNTLLQYLIKECDEITFHFPILNEIDYSTDELENDFKLYTSEKEKFLKELFNHGATKEYSKVYQGIRLGYETLIIRVKLYQKLIEKINNHHLFDWVWWNGLPEDPCFFSKNVCRFVTISHEETFYVCDGKKDHWLIQQFDN